MKKVVFICVLLNMCFFFYSNSKIYRYGIFIGAGEAFIEESYLESAGKTAKDTAFIFKEYCMLDDCIVITDPGIDSLSGALENAGNIVSSKKQQGFETHFIFYYYGHGLPQGLAVKDGYYEKKQLKQKVNDIDADMRLVFIDSCYSQVLGENEAVDFSTNSKGTVYITSSTRFQKSYAGIFTPFLITGLMGDADGFIPEIFDTAFFYNEIFSKMPGEDAEFVLSLYNIKKDYYLTENLSSGDKGKAKDIFLGLGFDSLPGILTISDMINMIPGKINNEANKKFIENIYQYNTVCVKEKKELNNYEKQRLMDIFTNAGFCENKLITLAELYCYLNEKIKKTKHSGQVPTITTSYMQRNDPIKLAYVEDKAKICSEYKGTVTIIKIIDEKVFQPLVQFTQNLSDDRTYVLLDPGKYSFFVETDIAEYRIDKEIIDINSAIDLPPVSYDNLVYYKDKYVESGKTIVKRIDKSGLEKNFIRTRAGKIACPAAMGAGFLLPLSFFITGIVYNYQAELWYDKYKDAEYGATDDPREKVKYNIDMRNNMYIAAAATLSLPVVPFILWMVFIWKHYKAKNDINNIKRRITKKFLPGLMEFSFNSSNVNIAYSIKF